MDGVGLLSPELPGGLSIGAAMLVSPGGTFSFLREPTRLSETLPSMKSGKCPKCQSGDIIADALVQSTANRGELTVATLLDPSALLLRGRQESTVSAWVCRSCGFVEFYADYPTGLNR